MSSSMKRSSVGQAMKAGGKPASSPARAAARRMARRQREPGSWPEQRRPAESVVVERPDEFAGDRVRLGRNAGAVVEHRINQVLEGELVFAAIARQQRQRGRQAAAGAFTHHADADRVDAERAGVCERPGEPGIAIFDARREAMLGRQAIVDADDHAVELVRERAVQRLKLRGAPPT